MTHRESQYLFQTIEYFYMERVTFVKSQSFTFKKWWISWKRVLFIKKNTSFYKKKNSILHIYNYTLSAAHWVLSTWGKWAWCQTVPYESPQINPSQNLSSYTLLDWEKERNWWSISFQKLGVFYTSKQSKKVWITIF